mmetsp:Transcript_293/g.196  ORF Transcript_293/g.196 Transcript_293/m.196 type:complete len:85 (+) Transcript_293:89-343(+)
MATSAQAPRLTFRLQESQDVPLTDWALHVPNERSPCKLWSRLVHELHPHLNHTTTRTCAAQNFLHLCKLGGVGVHDAILVTGGS